MGQDDVRLPDDKDAAELRNDPTAGGTTSPSGSAGKRNPIDEDMHADEPRVLGPDGSGALDEHPHQPYRGAD